MHLLICILSVFAAVTATKSPLKTFGSKLRSSLASIAILTAVGNIPPSYAADTVAVGKCLIQNCQKELAQCILNPKCLANVICLNTCNDRPDEAACQIKCGDLFENDVVGVFNSCAVSQKKCVPQKQSENEYPEIPLSAQVKKFDTSIWNGKWYISAGLNKIFDIFDCQVHFFKSPAPGKFYAKLAWRITGRNTPQRLCAVYGVLCLCARCRRSTLRLRDSLRIATEEQKYTWPSRCVRHCLLHGLFRAIPNDQWKGAINPSVPQYSFEGLGGTGWLGTAFHELLEISWKWNGGEDLVL